MSYSPLKDSSSKLFMTIVGCTVGARALQRMLAEKSRPYWELAALGCGVDRSSSQTFVPSRSCSPLRSLPLDATRTVVITIAAEMTAIRESSESQHYTLNR